MGKVPGESYSTADPQGGTRFVATAVQGAVDNDFYTNPSSLGHVHSQFSR